MACVKESIRVGMAVPGRLPRVVPNGDPFVVEGKVVPPGVSLVSLVLLYLDNADNIYSLQYIDYCWYFNVHHAQL